MNKKISYSKLITTIMLILFILTLFISFGIMIAITISGMGEIVDYVVCTTAITVVAGLLGMTMKYYFSKAGLENCAHIRKGVYREIMDVRLRYDREILKLRKQYGIDQQVIDDIECDAPFEDLSNQVINQTTSKLDSTDSDNEAEPEIQNF